MIALRMDRRLQGRLDASDVLQEAYLEAARRLPDYAREPGMPFFLWLRFLTGQKLVELHRHHLGVRMRDAAREVALYHGSLPETTSAALAAALVGRATGPSEAAMRVELKLRVQAALNQLEPLDREVLALRHFEQLSPAEVAPCLGIKERAASKRFFRALKRLKDILTTLPGGMGESWERSP
jgi:RNA polymerase sigma-70 factor (ECF subfamily)